MQQGPVIKGRVETVNVAGRDVHTHHHWPTAAPPDDPQVSVQCGQCGQMTWRYSSHCIHCHLDLAAWARLQQQPAHRRRQAAVGVLAMSAAVMGLLGPMLPSGVAWSVYSIVTLCAAVAYRYMVERRP
ncbi:MAG: hypothetical protein IIZ92_28690 [Aquincola sp.]|nr:hypothetical protein [Aquincola sp.]